jgi:hypothetical protein
MNAIELYLLMGECPRIPADVTYTIILDSEPDYHYTTLPENDMML